MTKKILVFGAVLLFPLLVIPASPGAQDNPKVAKVPPPHISAVSQQFYPLANKLILEGRFFPPKTAANSIRRNIRLVSTTGGSYGNVALKAYVFYAGETGNWTPTRVDDLLGLNVQAGRRYRVGLVEFQMPGPNTKTLISNEVEILLLMNLDQATPNPVHLGTTEIEVITANELGPQGSKIVKLGGIQAPVVQWGTAHPANFKIGIPHGLNSPGTYDLYVEENGTIVSKKLPVQLLATK